MGSGFVKGLEVLAGTLRSTKVRHEDTEPLQVCARHVEVHLIASFADMADLVHHLGAAWANPVPTCGTGGGSGEAACLRLAMIQPA